MNPKITVALESVYYDDGTVIRLDVFDSRTLNHREAAAKIARILESQGRLAIALEALVLMHDDQVFICGEDDANRVSGALDNARKLLSQLKEAK